MYLHIMSEQEQEQVVRALKGWQFMRSKHGSLYDRGSSDSYYGRRADPHYGGVGGDSGERRAAETAQEVNEYLAGYEYNEQHGDRKEWR